MGAAADAAQLSIQYCMAHSRHILASAEVAAVTQARASDDYHPGGDQWHQLGTTSMFAYALGLAPSKDNFWSTSVQPGSPYGNATTEPRNRLQAAVLTLTKGPVCPSDAVGRSDPALIMRSAAADGTLLQPGAPAMMLDQQTLANALLKQPATSGQLWAAPTTLSGRRFVVVFSARLTTPTTVAPAALGYGGHTATFGGLAAVESNLSARIVAVDARHPLALAPCGEYDFAVWNLAPRETNGWALLGEVATKWVGVSTARFAALASPGVRIDPKSGDPAHISVDLRGKPGERVVVGFAPPLASGADTTAATTVSATCVVGSTGTAWAAASGTHAEGGYRAFCSGESR